MCDVRLVTLSLPQVATRDDQFYRCTDGMFTNRVERQCASYESEGIVRVQGGIADTPKQSVVEVKHLISPQRDKLKHGNGSGAAMLLLTVRPIGNDRVGHVRTAHFFTSGYLYLGRLEYNSTRRRK